MNPEDLKALQEYRRKHFAVEINEVAFPLFEDEFRLSITTNGRQWESLSLTVAEAKVVVKALNDAIRGKTVKRGGR